MTTTNGHERPEKILTAMYDLSAGTSKPLQYEDIVVRAFTLFPKDFALRGHPEYPDSSDLHKPLYGPLKRHGFVLAANKSFQLTPSGIEEGRKLAGRFLKGASKPVPQSADRITREHQLEADRMAQSDAFGFYTHGQRDKILDTDFYVFLGCTVRTPPNDFLGRMQNIDVVLAAARKTAYPDTATAKALKDAWGFLTLNFKDLIDRRKGRK